MPGQVCSTLERNSWSGASGKGTDEARKEQERNRTEVRKAVTSQSPSRSKADEKDVKQEAQQSERGQDRER